MKNQGSNKLFYFEMNDLIEKKVVDIACSNHSFFMTADRKLYGCGYNNKNQLSITTKEEKFVPITLIEEQSNISQIFVGANSTIILRGMSLKNPCESFIKANENDLVRELMYTVLEYGNLNKELEMKNKEL